MIIDRPESHFIFIFPPEHVYERYNYINYKGKPLANKDYLEHWGKWLVFGSKEELDLLAQKISPRVDSHEIPAVKYDREIIDAFGIGECVMCVYCDVRQRDDVWEILHSLDVEDKAWGYERETMEKWLPGGLLLEKWIASHDLTQEQADSVREGSKLRFKDMFEDETAIFKGVEQ
ncbi:MAG: hypothetical protein KAH09_03225 [Desulfobacula sp.]|nr:hypothetical protein [Desulfobacula sp.]